MIQSMTGYGKGRAELSNGTLTVEIRSVNSKSADIAIKSSLLPKEHEMEVRKRLAERLVRGTVDMFLTWEPSTASKGATRINAPLAREYFDTVRDTFGFSAAPDQASTRDAVLAAAVLRLPDIVGTEREEIVTEENWHIVSAAIDEALDAICKYRADEGESLQRDVTARVGTILGLYDEIESYEKQRIEAVRERILKNLSELKITVDESRFEQEMVFYLEKLDINEEKVRLRQHCKYFMETIGTESCPGKKLGFIIQEMGREINTTGSKANHAGIQKCVVRAKDELEKIREQSCNIL